MVKKLTVLALLLCVGGYLAHLGIVRTAGKPAKNLDR